MNILTTLQKRCIRANMCLFTASGSMFANKEKLTILNMRTVLFVVAILTNGSSVTCAGMLISISWSLITLNHFFLTSMIHKKCNSKDWCQFHILEKSLQRLINQTCESLYQILERNCMLSWWWYLFQLIRQNKLRLVNPPKLRQIKSHVWFFKVINQF